MHLCLTNKGKNHHILLALTNTKKGNIPISKYFRNMKFLNDEMTAVGHPLEVG